MKLLDRALLEDENRQKKMIFLNAALSECPKNVKKVLASNLNNIDAEGKVPSWLEELDIENVSYEDSYSNNFMDIKISYDNFVLNETPEEIIVRKETIEQVAMTVVGADIEDPEKQYLQIYKMRYDKEMTQKEISQELGLSQSEVSKRLFKLMEKVKQSFR